MAQKIYESYNSFKKEVTAYHEISEKANIETRDLD